MSCCALCCVRSYGSCIRCWLRHFGFVRTVNEALEFTCHPYQMYTSSFQRTLRINKYYFIYRCVMSFVRLSAVVVTWADLGVQGPLRQKPLSFYSKYPIYLTYWILILGAIDTSLAVIIITAGVRKYGFSRDLPLALLRGRLSAFQFIYWKLMAIYTTMALTITTVFWLVFFPRIPGAVADVNNIMAHGTNSISALIDLAVTGLPINFSDVLWCVVFGCGYFLFSFIYWHAGGLPRPLPEEDVPRHREIYPKCLDWSRLKFPFLCAFFILSHICFSHVVVCALMQAKVRWMPRFEEELTSETSTALKTSSYTYAPSYTPSCLEHCICHLGPSSSKMSRLSKVTPGGDV